MLAPLLAVQVPLNALLVAMRTFDSFSLHMMSFCYLSAAGTARESGSGSLASHGRGRSPLFDISQQQCPPATARVKEDAVCP